MPKSSRHRVPLLGKTAVVCGGSKGIGKATAERMAQLGASVCIVARNTDDLNAAAKEIKQKFRFDRQFVEAVSCDATDFNRLKPLLDDFVFRRGVPDYLINSVGYAYPQYVEKLTFEDFKASMETNYLGHVAPILVLLPHFMRAGKGHIASVSSMMGYFGIMGYAAYAPTKFAVAGLAQSLRHELRPFNIWFSVLYPPDTRTPGFEIENRTKPAECALMSENVKLMEPEAVAKVFVSGILKNKFGIFPGGSGFVWRMNRHFPRLVRWILDLELKKARQRVRK